MTLLLSIIFGDKICQAMGIPIPDLLIRAQNSQFTTLMIIYYIGNMISTNLMNTGAFEITYNDNLVWSKLGSGRLPSWPELIREFEAAGMPSSHNFDTLN
eukprot:m.9512 g.9512  ORF g.9512 m.9512 type:complete len:100 (+) comp4077_c0_seq1:415-714(+)